MDLSNRQGRREQGQRIQTAVERAGLSIEELANRIGCSRALIYQYLSGSTLAQPDRLQQIAALCEVPLSYFYADGEEAVAQDQTDRAASPPAPQDVTQRLTEGLRSLQELADAQAGPPDYRALASTCERILSIAYQLGDRPAQTRAQLRLGNSLLSLAEFPRAADALSRAIVLATENGDGATESAARQSLGNALLQMGRSEEARDQFSRIAAGSDFTGRWQGTLSLGSVHELRGEYQQAMQKFDEAAAILEEGEANGLTSADELAIGQVYVNTNRRNVYMDGGDFKGARPLAERGLSDAESMGNADQHLEARFDLAWCDLHVGRWQQAHYGLSKTLQLARFVGDQGRETMTRAWLGIFLASAGDYDAATGFGKDALARSLSRGDRRSELYSQLALADAYTGQTRRESEARYHTGQALAVATALRQERQEAECRIRLARVSVQSLEWAEANDAASRALSLSVRLGARHIESLAHYWLAEALLGESGQMSVASPAGSKKDSQTTIASEVESSNALRVKAEEEGRMALQIAEDVGLAEGMWRSRALLARLASNDTDAAERQEALLRDAISTTELLRSALTEAGIPDTLLEDQDCAEVYVRLVNLLYAGGRNQEAVDLLEQIGWPPLASQVNAERTGGSTG